MGRHSRKIGGLLPNCFVATMKKFDPRALGINAFHLDRSGKQRGDFVISNLKDLGKRFLAEMRRQGEADE